MNIANRTKASILAPGISIWETPKNATLLRLAI